MPTKTVTHNFTYTKEDIVNLIKSDIAKQLDMKTIPIIDYSITGFKKGEMVAWSGIRNKFIDVKVEVPG